MEYIIRKVGISGYSVEKEGCPPFLKGTLFSIGKAIGADYRLLSKSLAGRKKRAVSVGTSYPGELASLTSGG